VAVAVAEITASKLGLTIFGFNFIPMIDSGKSILSLIGDKC
jgi:hypothetical protein